MEPIGILLIEDDLDDVFLIQRVLDKDQSPHSPPVRIKTATTLRQGLEILQQSRPDLLLLDLTLPDSRGLDTLKVVLAQDASLPIVVLTALDDETTAIGAMGHGAQDYLVKDHISPTYFKRSLLYAIERQRIRRELQALNDRLQELSQIDPLSGLLNRRGLQQIFSKYAHRIARQETDMMAVLIDLDDFKRINDSLGHKTGDIVVTEVAHRLASAIRAADHAARVGGDEFLVLLPETRQAEGMHVAEKIRLAISADPFILSQGTSFKVTASLGLVTATPEISSVDELLEEAHAALARSKSSGKNVVSHQDDGAAAPAAAELQKQLRVGNTYRVFGQNIVRLSDRQVVGMELLTRSTIAPLEMPSDFFRYSQERNFLTSVDHQCLRNCHAALRESAQDDFRYHINVFPSTLLEIPTGQLLQELHRDGERKAKFCYEISEQQLIGDPAYLIPIVSELRKEGIQVAIDDVGFGRSCLESLILLEPDIVKIDKGCVRGLAQDAARVRSLRRILNVARALNTGVIAEGIETAEDLKVLVDLGVEYGQGFFLDKPRELASVA